MFTYYVGYRIGSSALQCEKMDSNSSTEVKKMIEARYRGEKLTFPHPPTQATKAPGWFKG